MKNYSFLFIFWVIITFFVSSLSSEAFSFKNLFHKKITQVYDYVAEDNLLENYMQVPFVIVTDFDYINNLERNYKMTHINYFIQNNFTEFEDELSEKFLID